MTDQEIIQYIDELPDEKANDMEYSYTTGRNDGFLLGARWMRDIALGNKDAQVLTYDKLSEMAERMGYRIVLAADGYND